MGNHGWLRLIEAWCLPMLVIHLVLPWVCENSRAATGTLIPASSEDSSTAQVVLLGLLQEHRAHSTNQSPRKLTEKNHPSPFFFDQLLTVLIVLSSIPLLMVGWLHLLMDRNMLKPLKLPKDPKKIGGLASHIFQENLATLAHRQNNFDYEVGLDPNNYCRS